MYKVLLVDDELFSREALKKTIPWEQYGCSICGEAKNGFDGIEKAMALKPDIILTDIDMPFMNGLDMIMELQRSLPGVMYSIITGYSEFQHAKRGIELGVEFFILKPVDDQEMIKTIQKMVDTLNKRHEKEQEYESLKFWAEKNTEENRKKFLIMLLSGDNNISESQFLYECEQLNIPMKKGGYGVCCLKIDSRTYVHYNQKEWQCEIENIMKQIGEKRNYTVCYKGKGNLYIIFSDMEENEWNKDVMKSLMQKIQIIFMQKWVCTIKAGIGQYYLAFRDIAKSRLEAESAVREIEVSKLITEMLQFIYKDYGNPDFSLKIIAEKLFVNYSYLSAQFTKEMGMSASQYITRFRMTKAADAIRDGQENMVEIACSVGYTDVKYFYRCFKKEFGITPYQYVDIIRGTKDIKDEL